MKNLTVKQFETLSPMEQRVVTSAFFPAVNRYFGSIFAKRGVK
jgi:hypothetical protein